MTRDHMMGYPPAARWSAEAGQPVVKRVKCSAPKASAAAVLPLRTLADYLPTGVTQCSDSDRRGISRNPEIRAVRFRGVLIEFDKVLGQVMGYDTCDC